MKITDQELKKRGLDLLKEALLLDGEISFEDITFKAKKIHLKSSRSPIPVRKATPQESKTILKAREEYRNGQYTVETLQEHISYLKDQGLV